MGILTFISYATIDSQRYKIKEVATELKNKNNIVDVLYWEMHMDDDIMKYMNDNIARCDVILLFCSKDSLISESVQMEWMSALKLKKKVIPVFTEEQHIPPLLTTKRGIFFDESNFSKTIDTLYDLIIKKQEGVEIQISDGRGNVSIQKESLDIDIENLTEKVADAIFNTKKELVLGKCQYWVKKYKSNNVRYLELPPYRFLEQNPSKPSEYGKMAKSGKKVLWIMKSGKYFARWIDGEFIYMG